MLAGDPKFVKGDSNRCRTVYEQVLRAALKHDVLDAQKKNKHVSVGRCRMLAINHEVKLPSYEALSRVSWDETHVPLEEWYVPIGCKRFHKSIKDEGLCTGRCDTCDQLMDTPPPLLQASRPRRPARATRPPGWAQPESLPTGAEVDDDGFQTTPGSSEPVTPALGPLLVSDVVGCMQHEVYDHITDGVLLLLGGGGGGHGGDVGGGHGGGGGGGHGGGGARPCCTRRARRAPLTLTQALTPNP